MTTDATRAITRRGLLGSGFAALAAATAAMLGRPLAAQAANGQTMTVGGDHTGATSATKLSSPGNASPTLYVENQGTRVALATRSTGGDGVTGRSGGSQKSGVYGRTDAANGFGVYGYSSSTGTRGSLGGPSAGVEGTTTTGVAVRGTASNQAGVALQVDGRIKVAKAAGKATIPAGKKFVTVSPGIDLMGDPLVILTPRKSIGQLWALYDTSANTITIRTNVNLTSSVTVNYLIIG
ncbi:MAG: hypothetical protein KF809_06120 [Chloroflexi bacterium]|nr:hypothetical protein [Chloroflexota bacterium]